MTVTAAMIERAGRALAAWENEREHERAKDDPSYRAVEISYEDWKDEFNAQARVALLAALSE